jgi:hypothetical protein
MNKHYWIVVHTPVDQKNIVCGPFNFAHDVRPLHDLRRRGLIWRQSSQDLRGLVWRQSSQDLRGLVWRQSSQDLTSVHDTLESALADESKMEFVPG